MEMKNNSFGWIALVAFLFAAPIFAFFLTGQFTTEVVLGVCTAVGVLTLLLIPRRADASHGRSSAVNSRLRAFAYKSTLPATVLLVAAFLWFPTALLIVPHTSFGEEIAVFPSLCFFVPGIILLTLRFYILMLDLLGRSDP